MADGPQSDVGQARTEHRVDPGEPAAAGRLTRSPRIRGRAGWSIEVGSEHGDPPFVDEHQIRIPAPRDLVWSSLRRYASSLGIGERNPLA